MQLPILLRRFFECGDYRLTDLAKDSDLHAPDLSRIANGKRVCGKTTVTKLLKGSRVEHRSMILQAWLEDMVPDGYIDLVHIVRNSSEINNTTGPEPGSLEGCLHHLGKAACSNEALQKVLIYMAEMHTAKRE